MGMGAQSNIRDGIHRESSPEERFMRRARFAIIAAS
jgi:hypothetical protein